MSQIKDGAIPINQWVKERLEQLSRIDGRFESNIQKYRQRKSASSEGSEARQSADSRDSREVRESAQCDYDEIADDWRKLKHTLEHQIPLYMSKHSSSKVMRKISTVRQQSDRVKQKIEARIEEVDLRNYRYKQSLKQWESSPKISIIRGVKADNQEEKAEFQEVKSEESGSESPKRSLILEDLNSIGSEKLKMLDKQVNANEKLVGEYETEKIAEKIWTKVLLGLIAALIVAGCLGLRIETQFHKILFDFLSG